jgi:hypothetical protein
MKPPAISLLPVLALIVGMAPAAAQGDSYPSFDFKGLVFGDAYHVPSHHLEEGDDATGLVMRRIYLTLDADLSTNWFTRARLEYNQDGEFETYEYDGDWKDLYLGVKLGRHTVLAGLAGTPTFDLVEKVWGARYLARTPMDMQGVASRDTGIAAKGPLNASGTFGYRLMWAAPTDFGKESNPNDRLMGAVSWSPRPEWTFDFYLDHEDRPEHRNRTTWQLFVGYDTELLRWGAQYSNQNRQDDPSLELASVFAVAKFNEKSSLITRIDRIIEPSPKGNNISYIPFDPSTPATMYLGAFEYRALPNLTLTPNFIVIDYDRVDGGDQPDTDVHLRLTAYFRF